ncbi:MAG: hypothetical protein Kow009_00180 [Spirochaetales bacterium]
MYEPAILLRLSREIEGELELLKKLKSEFEEVPESLKATIRNRVIGSLLHDFYSGLERIFKRIAVELNGGVPKTETWHRDLLVEMSWDMPEMRRAVITERTMKRLLPYLRFRHVFRNLYGFELESSRIRELESDFSSLCNEVLMELEDFVAWLRKQSE